MLKFLACAEAMVNRFSCDWTVVTARDLSLSHLFLFNIYYDGELDALANSQTFNITDGSENSSITSTSSNFATGSTSSVTSALATNTPTAAETSAAAGPIASKGADQSGGMSTGAKVSIGIAVAVLALGGLAAGYFLYGRRVKKQQQGAASGLAPGRAPKPTEQKPAGSVAHHPQEMDSMYSHSMRHELDSGTAGR